MAKKKARDAVAVLAKTYGISSWPETIQRFIQTAHDGEDRDARAVADLLRTMWVFAQWGEPRADGWESFKGPLGMRKLNVGAYKFRPDEATIDSPAFAIVTALVRDQVTRAEAVALFQKQVANADAKTIGRWIDAIEPRARSTAATLDRLEQMAKQAKTDP